ncbi:arsenate reductase ArsC [Massilia arenosa]|uniref:Arsenate reductase ArsC n=1 Tax=Zemynaea arenosa TaxID=2561931 RepID=A0A4Y9S408_9BURK|nr:arsenate reductase ArsC [Massilia arenosa]TFW16063.1 arsenate reductase ArsC [Massilia arenosa]
MTHKTYNVLFLCTGNSARSIMAEGLVSQLGGGRFRGFSAGSQPTGRVNPFAIEQLQAMGYPTTGLRSKSWDEFGEAGTAAMDAIITVCDNAAGETCPLWPGFPATAHWGFEDPAAAAGTDDEKRAAFARIRQQIERRVESMVALPLETMSASEIEAALRHIGSMPV